MNYYVRHLGDYAKDTRHLSLMEHGAYTVLMDFCYASERALPLEHEQLYRICAAFTKEEQRAVIKVTGEFFTETAEGYIQKRVEEELQKAHAKTGKAKASALARWDANAMRTQCERNANGVPTQSEGSKTRARSQYPVASSQYLSSAGSRQPEGADLPLTLVSDQTPSVQVQGSPPKKERGRDECFEFLVQLTGATLETVTKGMRGEINTALRDIRTVMPEVTAVEMKWRAAVYRQKWPNITCSPSALAKHWGSLETNMKKEGDAAGFSLVPADSGVAGPPEGWESAMEVLWGEDWQEVYAAWEMMPPSDHAQVRKYLAQQEGRAA